MTFGVRSFFENDFQVFVYSPFYILNRIGNFYIMFNKKFYSMLCGFKKNQQSLRNDMRVFIANSWELVSIFNVIHSQIVRIIIGNLSRI
jgi:hypothetical protein